MLHEDPLHRPRERAGAAQPLRGVRRAGASAGRGAVFGGGAGQGASGAVHPAPPQYR